jgi:hypothetical protein
MTFGPIRGEEPALLSSPPVNPSLPPRQFAKALFDKVGTVLGLLFFAAAVLAFPLWIVLLLFV